MSWLSHCAGPFEAREFLDRLYRGELLVVTPGAAAGQLRERLDAYIRGAFGTDRPPSVHRRLPLSEYLDRSQTLGAALRHHAKLRGLFAAAVGELGLDPEVTAWDGVHLRVQPPLGARPEAAINTLGPHRDTWGSGVAQQINWWMPVYPVTAGRTIAFYPGWWERPVPNDSASWTPAEARAGGRIAPMAETPPPASEAVPVVVEPGCWLCFSGAHLHASTTNRSSLARFSVEIRTVHMPDRVEPVRGAPDIDGQAPRARTRWFTPLAGIALAGGVADHSSGS